MPKVTTKPQHREKRNVVTTRPHVWTTFHKFMGNFIPFILAAPFAAYGLWWMLSRGEIMGRGLLVFGFSPLIGWLAMNFLGLFQNNAMRREMVIFLRGMKPKLNAPRFFVGMATPRYSSLLDPHQDVGFLILHPDRLEFFGDHMNLAILRYDVSRIGFRWNAHTLVGLGRWVTVDGKMHERAVRLQIEMRERPTLFGNMLLTGRLKKRLENWVADGT